MKKLLFISLFCVLLIFSSNTYSQDVYFPPSIIAAGGGTGNGSTMISKWRIGKINILQITEKELKSTIIAKSDDSVLNDEQLKVSAYPNPVNDYLKIQFDMDKSRLFGIMVIDISGRKIIDKKVQLIIPHETIQLDLSKYSPAIYLVNIYSEDKKINKTLKVSKQ